MQQFLGIAKLIPGPVNYKHFIILKNFEFNNFCDCDESTSHAKTSPFTLFVMQMHVEDRNNNEEVYSARKLVENVGALWC